MEICHGWRARMLVFVGTHGDRYVRLSFVGLSPTSLWEKEDHNMYGPSYPASLLGGRVQDLL
jgi:hypothetical protein